MTALPAPEGAGFVESIEISKSGNLKGTGLECGGILGGKRGTVGQRI
jgi:hypothetical protein